MKQNVTGNPDYLAIRCHGAYHKATKDWAVIPSWDNEYTEKDCWRAVAKLDLVQAKLDHPDKCSGQICYEEYREASLQVYDPWSTLSQFLRNGWDKVAIAKYSDDAGRVQLGMMPSEEIVSKSTPLPGEMTYGKKMAPPLEVAITGNGVDVHYKYDIGAKTYYMRIEGVPNNVAEDVLIKVLPQTLQLWLSKCKDYGGDISDEVKSLGPRGQFVDIWRKVWKLKRALWDGEELKFEQPKEVMMDLIGHLLLAIRKSD
jgi:hypothetical protein